MWGGGGEIIPWHRTHFGGSRFRILSQRREKTKRTSLEVIYSFFRKKKPQVFWIPSWFGTGDLSFWGQKTAKIAVSQEKFRGVESVPPETMVGYYVTGIISSNVPVYSSIVDRFPRIGHIWVSNLVFFVEFAAKEEKNTKNP